MIPVAPAHDIRRPRRHYLLPGSPDHRLPTPVSRRPSAGEGGYVAHAGALSDEGSNRDDFSGGSRHRNRARTVLMGANEPGDRRSALDPGVEPPITHRGAMQSEGPGALL